MASILGKVEEYDRMREEWSILLMEIKRDKFSCLWEDQSSTEC